MVFTIIIHCISLILSCKRLFSVLLNRFYHPSRRVNELFCEIKCDLYFSNENKIRLGKLFSPIIGYINSLITVLFICIEFRKLLILCKVDFNHKALSRNVQTQSLITIAS